MSGFFQGGFAEGSMGAQKMALAERAQTEQTELGRGELGLKERQFGRQLDQDTLTRGDALIAQNMAVVSETIKNAVAVGTPPEKITQTVMPLVQSAQAIAQRIGRDPAALAAQVQAEIARPGAVQVAEVTGTAGGRAAVAGEAARQQVPLPPAPVAAPAAPGQPTTAPAKISVSPFTDPKDRVTAEGALRDDYIKNTTDFRTIRDANDRMAGATPNGAGDLALVFSYMKMLDPGSTVRESEFRSASQIAGLPGVVDSLRNKILCEGQLPQDARNQIKAEAKRIWTQAAGRHSTMTNQFATIAKRQGLRPENVIVDFTTGGGSDIPPPPAGFRIIGR